MGPGDSPRGDRQATAHVHGGAGRGSGAAHACAAARRARPGDRARARGGTGTLAAAAPDYIEPVVGWRAWAVVRQRGRLRLRSVVFDTVWPADAELVAGCNRVWTRIWERLPWRGDAVHAVPVWRCGCGIYAADDPELAAEYLYLYGDVQQPGVVYRAVGLVSLWGAVVEAEAGWRASHAYPQRLFIPPTRRTVDAEAIRDGLADYGVPVEILGESETPIARAVERVRRNRVRWRRAALQSA